MHAAPVWAIAAPAQEATGMSGEVSFDVVSEFDAQELRNALDQVRRETQQRYDSATAFPHHQLPPAA